MPAPWLKQHDGPEERVANGEREVLLGGGVFSGLAR